MRKSENPYEQDRKTLILSCCLKHAQLAEQWKMSPTLLKQVKDLSLSNRTDFFFFAKNTNEAKYVTTAVESARGCVPMSPPPPLTALSCGTQHS